MQHTHTTESGQGGKHYFFSNLLMELEKKSKSQKSHQKNELMNIIKVILEKVYSRLKKKGLSFHNQSAYEHKNTYNMFSLIYGS
jgi:hypothetical protein